MDNLLDITESLGKHIESKFPDLKLVKNYLKHGDERQFRFVADKAIDTDKIYQVITAELKASENIDCQRKGDPESLVLVKDGETLGSIFTTNDSAGHDGMIYMSVNDFGD